MEEQNVKGGKEFIWQFQKDVNDIWQNYGTLMSFMIDVTYVKHVNKKLGDICSVNTENTEHILDFKLMIRTTPRDGTVHNIRRTKNTAFNNSSIVRNRSKTLAPKGDCNCVHQKTFTR